MHWLAKLLYRTLLQKAGQLSTRPDIPSDPAQLMNILGVPAPTWDIHAAAVLSRFQIDPETGLLFHPRLRRDHEKYCLYIAKQARNGKKGGRPRQAIQTTGNKPTANPPLTQNNQRKVNEMKEEIEITHDDDAVVPSASLGYAATLQGESTANPTPPSAPADKKKLCDELCAFVFTKSGFQPPNTKSVMSLLDQYPLDLIKEGFLDAIWEKSKGDVLATVKLFFLSGAPGIILAHQQKEFLEGLKYLNTNPERYTAEEFEASLADAPAGMEEAVWKTRNRRQQFVKSQTTATQNAGAKA
jgi:hypothetical protein